MDNTQYKTFGEWLAYWRKKTEHTQPELGKKIGVSGQQISNLERGLARPTTESVDKLSRIFKRPVKEVHGLLFGNRGNIPEVVEDEIDLLPISEKERGILRQQIIRMHLGFIHLPPEKRIVILEIFEAIQAGWAAMSIRRMLDNTSKAMAGKVKEIKDAEEVEIEVEVPAVEKDKRRNQSHIK